MLKPQSFAAFHQRAAHQMGATFIRAYVSWIFVAGASVVSASLVFGHLDSQKHNVASFLNFVPSLAY